MTSIAARLRALVVPLVALVTLLALTTAAPARAAAVPEPKAPAEFVALSDVDPTILQEMRYFTPHNFVGVRIDGYRQPLCILTRPAAEALHKAQVTLVRQGYTLKVYDCYRPQRAVDHFVAWAKDLGDQAMKAGAGRGGRPPGAQGAGRDHSEPGAVRARVRGGGGAVGAP
jgi:D-alanyl-D-alanine dipeptidase